MIRLILFIILFVNLLFSQDLESLLEEYESKTDNSLSTLDEKFGHVKIYSQKDLRLMQYSKVSDLLKETPVNNLSRDRFGSYNLTLPGTKTQVGGFFRFFINDHEVSTIYAQSPSAWIDMPIELIDHIEFYRGNSSFSLGDETGVFFIRIYTKKPYKENGNELNTSVSSKGSYSQSISHSESFENGWSYLGFFNQNKTNYSSSYNGTSLSNDAKKRYLYLDAQNDNTILNFGYTDLKKDNYTGFALDANSDDGEMKRQEYFLDGTKYLSNDKSLKLKVSFDVNNLKYEEKNSSGLAVTPVLDLSNLGMTIPKEYYSEIKLTKFNTLLSKELNYFDNSLLFALNFKQKKYDVKENRTVNFIGTETNYGAVSSFDKENISTFLFQDSYKYSNNALFIANAKIDKYSRNGGLEDFTKKDFRIGGIFQFNENFGLKTFYTRTSIPPSFYNMNFANKNLPTLKQQKYKYYTLEGVYSNENSKFSILYNDVKIKDFLYYTPIGFINVDQKVKTQGLILNYTYDLSSKNKIELNYYKTWLSETINNSNEGGYAKFLGEYDKFTYFTSLIYKNAYSYYDVKVSDSFNLNLGTTYNYSKNLSFSLKGKNLLDDSTMSLYEPGLSSSNFALEDSQRVYTFSMKWMF